MTMFRMYSTRWKLLKKNRRRSIYTPKPFLKKSGFFVLRFRESEDIYHMITQRRKRIFITLSVLFGVLLFALMVHIVLPYSIVHRKAGPIKTTPDQFNLNAEKTIFTTRDGLQLTGYWIYPNEIEPKAVMLLHHGIGGGKEHFYAVAKKLSDKGIACIVYDARAHGESDGEFISYGYYEKYDVSDIVSVAQNKHPHLPIGIWGNSMGGAIALQALAIEPKLDFGIIESTFTDLGDIVSDYQKRYTGGLRLRWISDYALERAGTIAHFNPEEVSPLASTTNIKQAVFLAHGTADPNIDFRYGKQLSVKLAMNSSSEFYPVVGGNHYNLMSVGGELYIDSIGQFIQKMIILKN